MRTDRGATLIELLVALALLSSIAVLSAQLVIQSTKLIDTTARASRNPNLVIATEWIRRDVYEAVSVVGEDLGWTEGPLVFVAALLLDDPRETALGPPELDTRTGGDHLDLLD